MWIKMVNSNFLSSILASISIILAIIGLYIVIRIWDKWRKLDTEVIKGRVFLNKKFLERNWLYVFLSGAAVTVYQSMGLARTLNLIDNDMFFILSEIFGSLTLVFLVILAYEWYQVLHIKK